MADEANTPLEYQVQTNAEQATGGLDRIVTILDRMDKHISGIASSLSTFKTASDSVAASFGKIRLANDRAFDTKRVLDFSREMVKFERMHKRLSGSGNADDLAISNAMKNGVAEAKRLNDALNKMDISSPAFADTNASLDKQMNALRELSVEYDNLAASRKAASDAEWSRIAHAAMEKATRVDPPDVDMDNRIADKESTTGWKQYSSADIQKEIDATSELEQRIRSIAALQIKGPEDLAKAFEAQKRFTKAADTNRANIVKFTADGDTTKAVKEAEKLAANEKAIKAYEAAINSADAAWKRLSMGEDISIANPEEYLEAEKNLKKLRNEVSKYSADLKRAKASGDSVTARKTQLKLDGAITEMERYTAALDNASQIRIDTQNIEQLEDVYKKIDKLRSQISGKETMGKTTFNSPALRKLKIDLTDAELSAHRLHRELGEISGIKATAEGAKLTAKALIQAKINASLLRKEAQKANRTFINSARVLQLMAFRMGIRAILKDMNMGFATLGDQFEPFNQSMSRMMDSATRVRNNLVSVFDPLIRVAAPVAEKWLDRIAVGFDRIAQAAAAMTGETMYTKLTSDAQDYAKTVNDVKNSLAGFDKFNTIGSQDYGNGAKFKTTVTREPIEDRFLKWKTIGEGLAEVWKGVEDVFTSLLNKVAKFFGMADNEDAFEFMGRLFKGTGKWLQEHADGVAKAILLWKALGLAIGAGFKAYNAGKSVYGFFKGLSGKGTAAGAATRANYVPGEAGALEVALKTAGSKIKSASAGAATKITGAGTTIASAAAGVGARLTGLLTSIPAAALNFGAFTLAGGIVLKGVQEVVPNVRQLGSDLKEYGYAKTGEEMSSVEAFFRIWKEKFTGKFASGGILPNNGNLFVANESGPELVGNFGNRTGVLNQSGIVDAVARGVASAVKSVMSGGNGGTQSINLTINLNGEAIYKDVIRRHNADARLRGKSPLTV